MPRLTLCFCCLLAALALTACGGSKARLSDAAAGRGPAPELGLPGPLELATRPRGASAGELQRTGADFDPGLPSNLVTAAAPDGDYSPGGSSVGSMAYAIYRFDTSAFASSPIVHYTWSSAPADVSKVWIGVANFDSNVWDWFGGNAGGTASLANMADYSNGGTTYVAVVLTGSGTASLSEVHLGSLGGYDEVEPNDSFNDPMPLPLAPVTAFKGSLGMGPDYPGEDGDCEDWYSIDAPAGKFMTIVVLGSTDSTQNMVLELRDGSNTIVGFPTYPGLKPATIEGVPTGAAQTYKLGIYCDPLTTVDVDFGDYYIYVQFTDAANAPPVSFLAVSPRSGIAPLQVSLDASQSYDDDPGDSISRYEWDFEGDGIFDLDSGSDATVDHDYAFDGIYHPCVRVYDSHGLPWFNDSEAHYPPGTRTVTVGDIQYDEREDNDFANATDANALPVLPFSTFTGNVGIGPDGYDGDSTDYFSFNASVGDKWTFVLDYTPAGESAPVSLNVRDKDFTSLGNMSDDSRCVVGITGTFTDLYTVEVQGGKLGDYNLSCVAGLPPDISISAPSFSGPAPLSVDFTATASDGEGPITKYEWDWNGDGTFDEDSGTDNTVTHNFAAAGTFDVTCRATDDDGLTTVSAAFSVYAWPQAYDEVEDNDSLGQANALSFPVSDIDGSIGPNGYYDGDLEDWFFLGNTAETRGSMEVNITTSRASSVVRMQLCNDSGDSVAETDTSGGSGQIRYSSRGVLIGLPQYIHLEYINGLESDYSITINTSDTPVASLTATPNSGTGTSLMVSLDGTASSDADGIVKYEFDPENTGVFIDNGNSPTLNHTYNGKGSYLAVLRVTDADGFTNSYEYHSPTMSWAFRRITVGTGDAEWYDETENNDNEGQAEALPAFPISNFRGSLGQRLTEYPGFDGDDDYYSFSAGAGQTLHLDVHNCGKIVHDPDAGWAAWITTDGGADLLAVLYDFDRVGDTASLDYTFASAGTYQLQFRNYYTYLDYRFDATMTGP